MSAQLLSGWREDPAEVSRIQKTLSYPLFMEGVVQGNEPALLYKIVREIAGADNLGAQGIGDCVSWGTARLVDYVSAIEIHRQIHAIKQSEAYAAGDPAALAAIKGKLFEFQWTATEPIYGLSRVEIGGWRGSRQDGSVGAWAAKAINRYGNLSYQHLGKLGLGDKYDARRAKEWGATGLPDTLEPSAAEHKIETVSMVTNFRDAAALIESGYGIAVCSNIGFENGPRGSTLRDAQGFAQKRGRWNHCMFFGGARFDRPGLCCINQWPLGVFQGPLDLDQPKNSFWVDERTVNEMLSQRDSWTASGLNGYPIRTLRYDI
jgi:hypothetical protein